MAHGQICSCAIRPGVVDWDDLEMAKETEGKGEEADDEDEDAQGDDEE